MSLVSNTALKKAYAKRVKTAEQPASIKLEDHLFSQQLAFVNDTSPFKVGICSRRAGKSTAVAADLVYTASSTPDCTALYVTGTRSDAKKIIWAEILKFNRKYKLGGIPNISELTLSLPNGSIVRLAGAKDEQEIEKIRGQLPPIKKGFIDEVQSIRDRVLQKLIDDVLEAALLDYSASLALLGTPGSVPTGYFHKICHNLGENGLALPEPVWSVHHWTFFDNPYIAVKSKKTHHELLQRVLKRRGVTIEDPSIQREYFGKWVLDSNSLLVRYDGSKNHFDQLPQLPSGKTYNYIMGIDLGFDDADAIAILAYSDANPKTYLVEELVVPQQGITELVGQVASFQKKYPISKMVIDQGGLGKKIAEELRRRHSIPVIAADKARKMEHIAFLNDSLRTSRFLAKSASKFAQDSYLVEINKEKTTSDKIVVSDKYHSDIIDAVLYAFIESPAFSYQAPAKTPKVGSKEWADAQQSKMFSSALDHFQGLESQNDLDKKLGFG